jgi:hypothetical protein
VKARSALALAVLLAGCTRTVPADVASFVTRVHRTCLDQDRRDPRALQFYEESEALRERYAAVCLWPSLEAARQELVHYLNAHPPGLGLWRDKIEALRRDCRTAAGAGYFSGALKVLREFGDRFGVEKEPGLAIALEGERTHLGRLAMNWARRSCADAEHEREIGHPADAQGILWRACHNLAGFDSARELVAKALADLHK